MFNLKNIFKTNESVVEKCNVCGQTSIGGGMRDNKYLCTLCIAREENIGAPIVMKSIEIKPVEEVKPIEITNYNPELDKTQNEALEFFSNIYGLNDVKENVYLTITSIKPIHRLLVSPPAGAKSLFGLTIAKKMPNVIYFDAANMSGAGLIETLYNNRNARIVIIDEIDKLKKNDQACLLGLLANGLVSKTLKGKRINFTMDVRVIATSNSTAKLSKPMLSRFLKTIMPEYSDDDFLKVVEFCLKGELPAKTAHTIAEVLIKNNKKDIRTALGMASLIRQHHDESDIQRIITNELKFNTEEVVDFN